MRAGRLFLGIIALFALAGPQLVGQETPKESPDKDATETLVVFKDGRRLIGKILRKAGSLQMIQTPLTKVWYNKNSVEKTSPIAADPPITYRLNKEGPSNRAKLQAVVFDLKWEGWTPMDALSFSCKDPKLGSISDTLECKQFSARLCFLDGLKFKWPHAWEMPSMSLKFFNAMDPPKTFEEELDRVKFLRQGEYFDQAEHRLSQIEDPEGTHAKALKDEETRLKLARDIAEDLEGKRVEGLGPKAGVKMPTDLPEATRAKLQDWWNRGAPVADVKSLAAALENTHKTDKDTWVTAVQALKYPANKIKPRQPTVVHWQDDGQDRHYSVFLPPNYDPSKRYATIYAMHGQTGNDEQYIQFWLEPAIRYEMIVVSIEYIYGRAWGYKFDKQDMGAVMGAVADSRFKFAVDPDRSYLIGHSQGGHTNFDITQSYVNEFAASAPFIGAPYRTQAQLIHQKNYPMYIVDGDLDGGAPKYCTMGIKKLLKENSPSVYVEYIGRGHEPFTEENDDMLLFFASHKRRHPWPMKTESHWARAQEGARHWIRIPEGVINTTRLSAVSKSSLLSIKASWSGRKIKISADKRLYGQSLEVLVPSWYKPDPKKPLEIKFNNKKAYSAVISAWNLKDYLGEVAKRNDRWTPTRQVIRFKAPPKVK